ncbi:MAG TPA: thymidylate synthase, partial [Candidatus Paceibacterota bacterium]|nr:thymidylate synthase [Candidatus Paceibacterota bacterium]
MSHNQHPEYQYLNLMQRLIDEGGRQEDAQTGDVTYSLFGSQMRYDLSEG